MTMVEPPLCKRQKAYSACIVPEVAQVLNPNNPAFWMRLSPRQILELLNLHDIPCRPHTEETLLMWFAKRFVLAAYRNYALFHGVKIVEDEM